LAELETQLILVKELHELDISQISSMIVEERKILSTMISKLNKKAES